MLVKLKESLECLIDETENMLLVFDRESKIHYKIKGENIHFLKSLQNNFEYGKLNRLEQEYCNQLIDKRLVVCNDNSEGYAIFRTYRNINAIQLEITKRCNFNCKHCYLGNERFEKDYLSTENIKSIICQASDLGVFEFDITGGEPLVRSDIRELLQYIYVKGMRTRLYTNGFLIDDEMIHFFKSINLYCVRISIDGNNENVHNSIRGVDSYKVIFENIEKLQRVGIIVEITTIVMKENYNQVESIINYLKGKYGLRHFIDCYIPVKNDKQVITPVQYVDAIQGKFDNNCFMHFKERHCGIGNSYCFIDSKGIARLCPMLRDYNCGDVLNENGLEKAWKYINRIPQQFGCKHKNVCVHKNTCDGGCRARAYYLAGDVDEKDIYFCYLQNQIKQKRMGNIR